MIAKHLSIGPYTLPNALSLAPMAGVTDLPFRRLCRSLGAGYVVGEMLASDPSLRNTRKSMLRRVHDSEVRPVAVQIAGSDPQWLAGAARFNVQHGAQIIDINMGCPAKKVCNRMAGSALLQDEALVSRILKAVVTAVDVPVTLKIRTGPDVERRNGPVIAQLAEQAGIAALAVHGRTRADRFNGQAEYETIRQICETVSIPVFANGDINNGPDAERVLQLTGADGVMIGRGAQGNPWIFREIDYYLRTGKELPPPSPGEIHAVLCAHLRDLHHFYGEQQGVRVARKHIGWYLAGGSGQAQPHYAELRQALMRAESAGQQLLLIDRCFGSRSRIAA